MATAGEFIGGLEFFTFLVVTGVVLFAILVYKLFKFWTN